MGGALIFLRWQSAFETMVGTGLLGSEYIVASKEVGNFDVTLGMGWGRLAGKVILKIPMTWLSDTFMCETVMKVGW